MCKGVMIRLLDIIILICLLTINNTIFIFFMLNIQSQMVKIQSPNLLTMSMVEMQEQSRETQYQNYEYMF